MNQDLISTTYGQYILLLIVVVFAIFAISRSYLRLRNGNESIIEFLFWTGLWTLIIAIVLVPEITALPARLLGIGRGVDVFIYFGLVFLFYSTYRIYSKIERVEQEITRLSRTIALREDGKKGKKQR
ncbi:DUF2304 family protein [Candidatus Woesearchaeota archaeon]|nr:DUF2304 family protein [Candidatus Woesearchaeota archaeon]